MSDAERADGGRHGGPRTEPQRPRRPAHPMAVVVTSGIGLLAAVLVGLLIVSMARVSYYLPPPTEGTDPVLEQAWNLYTLVWALGPLAAAVLTGVGLGVGLRGLARGSDVPGRLIVVPFIGMLLTMLGAAGAFGIPAGVYG